MLSNTNNFIWYQSFICTQLNGFKYRYPTQIILSDINHLLDDFKSNKWDNSSILPTNGILTCTCTPIQSGPGSNSHEGVLHIPQNSMTELSQSGGLVSYLGLDFEVCYTSVEIQSAYSLAPDNRAKHLAPKTGLASKNIISSKDIFSSKPCLAPKNMLNSKKLPYSLPNLFRLKWW